MKTAFISVILSILMAFTGLFSAFIPTPSVDKYNNDNFEPVLRFTAASDTHVSTFGDIRCGRITKALKTAYAIADADDDYNSLDAVIFAGDMTDQGMAWQYESLYATVRSSLREETQLIAILAKSHDGRTMGAGAREFFTDMTGLDTDCHYIIKGYHFISLSSAGNDELYTDEQVAWLAEQLAAAAADDADKPIFVAHHEHIADTVFGSSEVDGWGMDRLTNVLSRYPQVVDFSGHSHYPVNDPRSIWQGAFTAVGTGTLNYFEFTVDDENTIHPDGNKNAAQYWIVEVDAANRVKLTGWDILTGTPVCEYILEDVSDPSSFEYTPEKRESLSSAPAFSEDASAKISCIASSRKVTVPAAVSTDGNIVYLYRAEVCNAGGDVLISSWALSGYYFTPAPEVISVNINTDGLEKGNYTLKVYAENAYGMRSEPIITDITLK